VSDAPAPLQPTSGARFLLERTADSGARATYRAAIYTPDAVYASTATLSDDGGVELLPTGAPAALDAALGTFARLTARGAARRREDGLPAWPARVLRWRPDA
jgi:hypothetical protein